MKYLFTLLMAIVFYSSNAQFSNTSNDDHCIYLIKGRIHSIVDNFKEFTMDVKDIENPSIIERYPNGDVKRIRIDFTEGLNLWGKWTNVRSRYGEVIFKDDLPIAIYGYIGYVNKYEFFPTIQTPLKYYDKNDEAVIKNEDFTEIQKDKIKKLYLDFEDNLPENIAKKEKQEQKEKDVQKSVDDLWELFKKAQPINENSTAWKLAATKKIENTCISGNCMNGYGILIGNGGGYSVRYQYEGSFQNGNFNGIGIVKDGNGFIRVSNFLNGRESGAYLVVDKGLVELKFVEEGSGLVLDNTEYGFDLSDVQKHLTNSFSRFTKCNCLVSATLITNQPYQQAYEITNGYGDYIRTEYRTEYHDVEYPGLRNNCNKTIYIKAISRSLNSDTRKYEYFDGSFPVPSGKTIMKGKFYANYNSGIDDLQYLGQYSDGPVSTNETFSLYSSTPDNRNASKQGNNIASGKQSNSNTDNILEVTSYTSTTDFNVNKGDRVFIDATGSIVLGAFSGASGPDGITWSSDWTYVKAFPYGALMVSIGDGDWQLAGRSLSFIAQSTGKLNLRVNDTDPSDNSGSFQVKVSITKRK